jgi:hypothetical protein
MEALGQAIEEASSTSEERLAWYTSNGRVSLVELVGWLTKRSVLEGEWDNILDPLKWIGKIFSSEAFGDNNFDSSKIIPRVPIALR